MIMDSKKTINIAVKIFIGFFALLLIAVAGFYAFDKLNNKKAATVPANEQPAKNAAGLTADNNYQTKNISMNQGMGSFSDRFEACQKNPEDDFSKDNGNYYRAGLVAGMKALANRDISLCDKYLKKQEDKLICSDLYYVFTRNIENSDGSECNKIKDKEMAIFCKINSKIADFSICASMIADYNKAYCKAITAGDENICAVLSPEDKGQCEDNFFLTRAFQEKNLALCDKIKIDNRGGGYNKAYCKIILSSEPQKEWNSFYANNVCISRYAIEVAKEKKDISFCDNIPQKNRENQELYQLCKKQF